MKTSLRTFSPLDKIAAASSIETNKNIVFYSDFVARLVSNGRADNASEIADEYVDLIDKKLESNTLEKNYHKKLVKLRKNLGYVVDKESSKINANNIWSSLLVVAPYIMKENKGIVATYDLSI